MEFNKPEKEKKAYLILENGTVLEGKSFGEEGTVIGEAVFTTSMTGYQETLTDPAYTGQLVIQTFPLIGNYGVNDEDYEYGLGKINNKNKAGTSGYIVREYCEEPSNFRCLRTLNSFLKTHGIIGLYDIDTRFLTRILRENGVMRAMISTDRSKLDTAVFEIKSYVPEKFAEKVSVDNKEEHFIKNPIFNIAMLDFGYKRSFCMELNKLGCNVIVYPYNTSAQEILNDKPDGIIISSGPGNPADYNNSALEIEKLLRSEVPMFGIALGHQLMALANNGKTEKMKQGHHGGNQPVIDLESGRTYITAQNHGYVVKNSCIDENTGIITHINANDKSCEGICYKGNKAFSVQFYPESHGGINDTSYLFSKFILLMKEYNSTQKFSSFK